VPTIETAEERERRAHRALSGSSRVRILQALRDAGTPLDAFDLSQRVGLHHNTVRSHLEVLGSAGLVARSTEPSARPGRPRVVYRPTATPERHYETLSRVLADHLSRGAGPESVVEAGRAWGRRVAQGRPAPRTRAEAAGLLVEILAELGFAPQDPVPPADAGAPMRISLRACPFRDVALEHPEIVCNVHLGLLQGALEELGGLVEATGLEPFVEPELCVAHVAPASGEGPS
jgi:predicted ArsR family transcriptional regulator